jgi:hypothetical protein
MLIRNCLIVLFFICSSAVVFAQQPDYVADVSNEQLLFVANKGQIINEYGLPADDVICLHLPITEPPFLFIAMG